MEPGEAGAVTADPQTMRCADHPVFIAGDATDHLPVWHEAFDEGRIAADNALSYPEPALPRQPPLMVLFTDDRHHRPELPTTSGPRGS
ncbi:MAG: hypothetical protein U5L98_11370 [Halomonas sp.]|uniref:hypothetical protein n=1 Tax=Halomonas sp. TaxID=1486246 RepID=UPI002ACD2086|nr:hypothetical protein [Halomonas sp.]MDZ7853214.1 hypothetical protein [Halomonas sp.]